MTSHKSSAMQNHQSLLSSELVINHQLWGISQQSSISNAGLSIVSHQGGFCEVGRRSANHIFGDEMCRDGSKPGPAIQAAPRAKAMDPSQDLGEARVRMGLNKGRKNNVHVHIADVAFYHYCCCCYTCLFMYPHSPPSTTIILRM